MPLGIDCLFLRNPHLYDLDWFLDMVDQAQAQPEPNRPKIYRRSQ